MSPGLWHSVIHQKRLKKSKWLWLCSQCTEREKSWQLSRVTMRRASEYLLPSSRSLNICSPYILKCCIYTQVCLRVMGLSVFQMDEKPYRLKGSLEEKWVTWMRGSCVLHLGCATVKEGYWMKVRKINSRLWVSILDLRFHLCHKIMASKLFLFSLRRYLYESKIVV